MNMRVLDAVRKTPYADAVKNMQFDDLRGFVCFIPSVIVGEVMIIMYSNAISVRHRTSAVTSCAIDYETGVYTVETPDSVYKLQDLAKPFYQFSSLLFIPCFFAFSRKLFLRSSEYGAVSLKLNLPF